MSRARKRFLPVSACVLAACLAACVSTPFKGQAAYTLSDDQLLAELESVYQQLGLSTASLFQLRAMMPPPKLVITEHSFTTMSLDTQFVGDSAYTSGTATTTSTFDTHDQNDLNRSMNQLAQNIQLARINSLNSRRYELESEARRRIHTRQMREQELQAAVAGFFQAHPLLEDERSLLVTILPWEQATSYRETLDRVGFEAESVIASRATGRPTGRWYGTFQMRSESPTGASRPSSYQVRADLTYSEGKITLDVHFMSGAKALVEGVVSDDSAVMGHFVLLEKPEPDKVRDAIPGLGVSANPYVYHEELKVPLDSDIAGTVGNREIRLILTKKDTATGESLSGLVTLWR
jgi:hypothetical protein